MLCEEGQMSEMREESARERTAHALVPRPNARRSVEFGRRLVPEDRNARTNSLSDSLCSEQRVSFGERGKWEEKRLATPIANNLHQGRAASAAPKQDDMLSGRESAGLNGLARGEDRNGGEKRKDGLDNVVPDVESEFPLADLVASGVGLHGRSYISSICENVRRNALLDL
jgi:hypothetical protein